jgi:hypothetical protein
MKMTAKLIVCLLLTCLSACGGPSGPSLIGTWKLTSSDANASTVYTAVFSGSATSGMLKMDVVSTVSKTAMVDAGCVHSQSMSGTFTATATQLTVNTTSGKYSTTSCTDAAKNSPEKMFGATELAQVNAQTSGPYTLTDTKLTIGTGMNAVTFTRQ